MLNYCMNCQTHHLPARRRSSLPCSLTRPSVLLLSIFQTFQLGQNAKERCVSIFMLYLCGHDTDFSLESRGHVWFTLQLLPWPEIQTKLNHSRHAQGRDDREDYVSLRRPHFALKNEYNSSLIWLGSNRQQFPIDSRGKGLEHYHEELQCHAWLVHRSPDSPDQNGSKTR